MKKIGEATFLIVADAVHAVSLSIRFLCSICSRFNYVEQSSFKKSYYLMLIESSVVTSMIAVPLLMRTR